MTTPETPDRRPRHAWQEPQPPAQWQPEQHSQWQPQEQWQQPQQNWQPQWQAQPQWQPQEQPVAQPGWDVASGYTGWTGEQVTLMPPPTARKSHRGRVLIASAAAVAVAAGGVTTYVAVSSASSSNGAASARSAVEHLATDLGRSDLLGVLNDLPPNERTAIAGPFRQTVKELQRNGVVRSDANLHQVGGLSFSAQHLTFAAKTTAIGAHVQVVQITGGTLRVSTDVAKLPLTAAFFKAASESPHGTETQTVDIGRAVRASGKPVRVAVQQVGDDWYPSLAYTIADYAAADSGLPAPTAAQAVPARGESSADDAVSTMLTSLLGGDVRRAIELVSPEELPVLHDYGSLIIAGARYPAAPMKIRNIRFEDTPVSGGTEVGIRSLEVVGRGMTVKVDLTGTCPVITSNGRTQRLCADQLLTQFGGDFGLHLTAAQRQAFTDLFAGLADQRVRTSKIDGQWYVDPVQSYAELLPRLLSHLRGDDLLELISFSNGH